jgi:hypothetical protein
LIFLVIAAINFLLVGPILVGIPVPADQRLEPDIVVVLAGALIVLVTGWTAFQPALVTFSEGLSSGK